ncbi:acyl-CoA dehydrogenase family protein [Dermatobacter hominis]|uniref:acyl-CoA dehydrogenase family protein n=1 Tax=Dermatobacter hominis TaxID=2884263 RepID=UPI001D107B46|nr:acyl-CoA dehydrogenase family protein [Dermatobacter hominis]UDY36651.1 acyl-CoA dehydrogenase family protein [Dermatobacter hominis]
MELDDFRGALDRWLDDEAAALAPGPGATATMDGEMAQLAKVKRLTFDAGWMRWGWPERVGGLGGSPLLRGYLGEAVTARGLVDPGLYSMTEVLAPTMIDYAPPELAAEAVPRLLRGDETWCQGFSEPGTGSNLAALSCRATLVPGAGGDVWRVDGQKVWTSLAQYAQRCVLLVRTGTAEDAHRGITALFVDMDTPGITVRPIRTVHGRDEFSEVFFDGVEVPRDRQLGEPGQGWSVAMDLLPYERSTALWHRGAFLRRRLGDLVATAPPGALHADEVGRAVVDLFALRARSRGTLHRLDGGEQLGAETSIDKIMLATCEQQVFDLAADALADRIALGDDEDSEHWRSEFLYSRAATIYGGSAEIQRNIVARRLLDLGADR